VSDDGDTDTMLTGLLRVMVEGGLWTGQRADKADSVVHLIEQTQAFYLSYW